MSRSRTKSLFAADIFAGGGGLTVGLKKAGFNVVGAVELEEHAFATYRANHPEVRAFKQDIRTVHGAFLRGLAPNDSIDLLAGCPPCQGFSSLTAKYLKEDPRNELVFEMSRLVREIRPRAVMMENVPGLADKGVALFQQVVRSLKRLGYRVCWDVLQVADYGVPQSRRRLVLLAGLGFEIPIPSPTHDRDGLGGLPRWTNVRAAIGRTKSPLTLAEAEQRGGPIAAKWHVVRSLSPLNQRRLRYALPGKSWRKIRKELRPKCHQDNKVGFSNVYGRMQWGTVAPTITGGCTTLSKGRFGHPDQDRTISVREAATLQTFPRNYILDTPFMEYACTIVGNALPCLFAEKLAKQCVNYLCLNAE